MKIFNNYILYYEQYYKLINYVIYYTFFTEKWDSKKSSNCTLEI